MCFYNQKILVFQNTIENQIDNNIIHVLFFGDFPKKYINISDNNE